MTLTSYSAAGVHVELGDQFAGRIKQLARRPGHDKLVSAAGGYAAVYQQSEHRYLALTTDGVGTKVLLAHQYGMHHGVGIDLVAMCANDLICVGATPTLFLDYFATGRLGLDVGTALIEGILDGCDQSGMLLVGGETAEMPDVYQAGHYDLAGFAVGDVLSERLLTGDRIKPGQTVIGLASSGIHSNGMSLARKILTSEADQKTLLDPTRIYVKPVLKLFETYPGLITGVAHITGGGWRNLFRLNSSVGYRLDTPLPVLPIFQRMLTAGVTPEEGYKTFNMGMGLVLIVNDQAESIVQTLNEMGFPARIVGRVTEQEGRIEIPTEQVTLLQESK